MRIARKLIFLFCFIASFQAKAQIVNEIISYVDSTELIVNNGRKYLVNRIYADDHEKAREIYHYLAAFTKDKKYAAFDYTEELYLHLAMGDWQSLNSLMMNYSERVGRVADPKKEEIVSLLHEKVAKTSDSLLQACLQSDLDKESTKVTALLLHLTKAGTPDYQYNKLLKEFNKEYRKSEYNDFVLGYLPPLNIKSSLAFSMGSGTIQPTGKLKNYFSSNASFNLSMDINYHKLFTSLYLNTSVLNLETPFSMFSAIDTLNFNQNDAFSYLDGGLKVGYFLIRSDRFHVAPAITIGGAVLESDIYENDSRKNAEFEILNCFTFGPALHTEIKLFEYKSTDPYGATNSKYFSLKVEGGYNCITKSDFPRFKGNTAYVNIGLNWGTGYF